MYVIESFTMYCKEIGTLVLQQELDVLMRIPHAPGLLVLRCQSVRRQMQQRNPQVNLEHISTGPHAWS